MDVGSDAELKSAELLVGASARASVRSITMLLSHFTAQTCLLLVLTPAPTPVCPASNQPEGSAHPMVIVRASGELVAFNEGAREMLALLQASAGDNLLLCVGEEQAHLMQPGMHSAVVCGRSIVCVTRAVGDLLCLNPMIGEPPQLVDTGLTLAEVHFEDQLPSPLALAQPGLDILVVEDDEFQASLVRSMCEMNGFEVQVCDNGPEALQLVFAPGASFNLVLLDLVMSPMHGLDILKAIRKHNELITVVIISNSDEKHMVKACIHHGASSYIVKPVREKDLANIGQFVLQHNYQSLKLQHLRLNQLQLQQWSLHQLERERLSAEKEKAEAWAVAAKEQAERQVLEKEKREQEALLQASQERAAREAAKKEAAMEKERAEMQKQIMHMIYQESHKYMDLAKFYNDILVHVTTSAVFVHMSADAKARLGHDVHTTDAEISASIVQEDMEMLAGVVNYCVSRRAPSAQPSEPAEHFDLSFRCTCASGRLAAVNVHFYPIVDARGQIRTVIGAVPRHHARRAVSRKNVAADPLCATIRAFCDRAVGEDNAQVPGIPGLVGDRVGGSLSGSLSGSFKQRAGAAGVAREDAAASAGRQAATGDRDVEEPTALTPAAAGGAAHTESAGAATPGHGQAGTPTAPQAPDQQVPEGTVSLQEVWEAGSDNNSCDDSSNPPKGSTGQEHVTLSRLLAQAFSTINTNGSEDVAAEDTAAAALAGVDGAMAAAADAGGPIPETAAAGEATAAVSGAGTTNVGGQSEHGGKTPTPVPLDLELMSATLQPVSEIRIGSALERAVGDGAQAPAGEGDARRAGADSGSGSGSIAGSVPPRLTCASLGGGAVSGGRGGGAAGGAGGHNAAAGGGGGSFSKKDRGGLSNMSTTASAPSLSSLLSRGSSQPPPIAVARPGLTQASRDGERRLKVIRSYMIDQDKSKYTPLGLAALDPDNAERALRQVLEDAEGLSGRGAGVQVDLEAGCPNAGWQPLNLAITGGDSNLRAVQFLLEKGADIEAVPRNMVPMTPFLLAVSTCQVAIAQLLIEKKANVNARNKDGLTALHICCDWDNRQLAHGLISSLVRADADLSIRDDDGHTAEQFAARSGNRELEALLKSIKSPLWEHAKEMIIDSMDKELGPVNGPTSKNSSRNLKKATKQAHSRPASSPWASGPAGSGPPANPTPPGAQQQEGAAQPSSRALPPPPPGAVGTPSAQLPAFPAAGMQMGLSGFAAQGQGYAGPTPTLQAHPGQGLPPGAPAQLGQHLNLAQVAMLQHGVTAHGGLPLHLQHQLGSGLGVPMLSIPPGGLGTLAGASVHAAAAQYQFQTQQHQVAAATAQQQAQPQAQPQAHPQPPQQPHRGQAPGAPPSAYSAGRYGHRF